MPNNPLKSHADSRKERIDSLAATAGGGTVAGAGEIEEAPGVSLIASAWRRLRRNPVFLIGAGITLAFVVLAIVAPWVAPHDPTQGLLLDKVRTLTPEDYTRQFPMGLGSLARTLTHVMGSEWYYVQRMLDREVPPYEQWPIKDENPPAFSVIDEHWKGVAEGTRAAIRTLDETGITRAAHPARAAAPPPRHRVPPEPSSRPQARSRSGQPRHRQGGGGFAEIGQHRARQKRPHRQPTVPPPPPAQAETHPHRWTGTRQASPCPCSWRATPPKRTAARLPSPSPDTRSPILRLCTAEPISTISPAYS